MRAKSRLIVRLLGGPASGRFESGDALTEGESYPGLTIQEMGDSYYVKVARKAAAPAEEDEGLPAVALPVAAIAMAWVARRR